MPDYGAYTLLENASLSVYHTTTNSIRLTSGNCPARRIQISNFQSRCLLQHRQGMLRVRFHVNLSRQLVCSITCHAPRPCQIFSTAHRQDPPKPIGSFVILRGHHPEILPSILSYPHGAARRTRYNVLKHIYAPLHRNLTDLRISTHVLDCSLFPSRTVIP